MRQTRTRVKQKTYYSIRATPTTIITDAQGEVLEQAQGGIGKSDFLKLLAKSNPSAAVRSPSETTGGGETLLSTSDAI